MASDRKKITIRLPDEDQRVFEEMAERRGIAPSTLARIFVQDGLRGYQSQHDILLDRLEGLAANLDRVTVLAATSIVSAAMVEAEKIKQGPDESADAYVARYQVALKKHIMGAYTTGTELARAIAAGQLGEKGN